MSSPGCTYVNGSGPLTIQSQEIIQTFVSEHGRCRIVLILANGPVRIALTRESGCDLNKLRMCMYI